MLALGTAAAAQTTAPQNASPDTNSPAATTAAPDDGGEIIVTAQKRSERLQDVPVAVSVVSGATIDSLGRHQPGRRAVISSPR